MEEITIQTAGGHPISCLLHCPFEMGRKGTLGLFGSLILFHGRTLVSVAHKHHNKGPLSTYIEQARLVGFFAYLNNVDGPWSFWGMLVGSLHVTFFLSQGCQGA